jgi:penicillin-binding protein 2
MQALEQSCDTFYYQVGLKLGVSKIVKWTYSFGVGEKLNPQIEPKKARVPSPDWKRAVLGEPWFYGDTVNLSIGQGYLGITPFDATKIVVPIANKGKVLKPKILKAVYDKKSQNFIETKTQIIRSLDINKENLNAVKKGMYLVVYGKKGTAKILSKAPFKNAGKTGTAQVFRKPKKGEKITKWELQNHAWFVDMFPYKDPKFVIATFVEHGKGGSKTAAPITLKVIKAIKELNIN